MYYIIDAATRETIRTSDTPFNVDETVQPPLDNEIQLKLVVDDTQPTFDPQRQKLITVEVDNDTEFTRTRKYEIADLTNAELASQTQFQQERTEREQIKTLLADLKAGTGATVVRIARIEQILHWRIKNELAL